MYKSGIIKIFCFTGNKLGRFFRIFNCFLSFRRQTFCFILQIRIIGLCRCSLKLIRRDQFFTRLGYGAGFVGIYKIR